MDLRVRLLSFLLGVSCALVLAACVVVALSLREDVAEELDASARLVELMLQVGEAPTKGADAVEALLGEEGLRHIQVGLDRSNLEQVLHSGTRDPLKQLAYRIAGVDRMSLQTHQIVLGDGSRLLMRADPSSEIDEILQDAVRMIVVLVLFSGVAIAAAWWAADRALRPVRALERGLARLAEGDTRPQMPPLQLREYRQVAAAIEQLADSLARARANERQLARQLMALQESERRELARELHDEFGQSLSAINAAAAFVERHAGSARGEALVECAQDIRQEAARMTRQVRTMLSQLRPYGLEGIGMRAAIVELVESWRQRSEGVTIALEMPPTLPALDAAAGLALYRTLQEALTNVFRHAGAKQVRIALEAHENAQVQLKVADDGCGKAAFVMENAHGGVMGMRERAEMVGGELVLGASSLGGLEVRLALPLSRNDDNGDDNNDTGPVAG